MITVKKLRESIQDNSLNLDMLKQAVNILVNKTLTVGEFAAFKSYTIKASEHLNISRSDLYNMAESSRNKENV